MYRRVGSHCDDNGAGNEIEGLISRKSQRSPSHKRIPQSARAGIRIEHHTCIRSTDAPSKLHRAQALQASGQNLCLFLRVRKPRLPQNTPMDRSSKGVEIWMGSTDFTIDRYIAVKCPASKRTAFFSLVSHHQAFYLILVSVHFEFWSGFLSHFIPPKHPHETKLHPPPAHIHVGFIFA